MEPFLTAVPVSPDFLIKLTFLSSNFGLNIPFLRSIEAE